MGSESSLRVTTFMLILYLCNATISTSCMKSERAALLKLKQSLTDITGMLSSWTGSDCCRWTGVTCSRKHHGHVMRLSLDGMSLGGEISPSLLKLQQLRSLNLSMNDFNGIQIPDFFGSITNLRYLDLSNANFSGRVPHQLGNLQWLESLDLSRNNLSGTIPPSISYLHFLGHVNLSFNKLRWQIPQGSQLQTLVDASSYVGNDGLCGHPLLVACNGPIGAPSTELDNGSEDEASDKIWFYSGYASGCAVGLVVWSVLFFKSSWRFSFVYIYLCSSLNCINHLCW